MKAESIPFVREFGPGAQGPDVLAVKRALAKAGHGAGMALSSLFGKAAQADLVSFKKMCRLLEDPIYTVQTHGFLAPYFDEYGAYLLSREAVILESARQRGDFTSALRWMLTHKSLFNYAQTRPIPLGLTPFETSSRITTDCSGSVTLAAKWARTRDPNGLGFNGQGWTGTLLEHCRHITQGNVRAGDLIVYGYSPGHHVVGVLDVVGLHVDFSCFSHGRPGTPEQILHSRMAGSQASRGHYGVTFLSFLP